MVFFIVTTLFSQTQSTNSLYSLKTVLDDGEGLILEPLKWNLGDWLTFSAISGVTFGLHQYDNDVRKNALKEPLLYKDPGFVAARLYGDLWVGSTLAVGLFTYGTFAENEKCKIIGFELAESFLYSGIISGAIKIAAGRYRPNTNKGANSFLPFSLTTSRTSFPSGHTTIATALSTVLASHVYNLYLKIIIFTLPAFTASERILHDVHWTSDVFLGAAVGYFVSSYILQKHSDSTRESSGISIIPRIDSQGKIGITVMF